MLLLPRASSFFGGEQRDAAQSRSFNMADQEDNRGALASIFPNPPSYFWMDFTPENLERFEKLRNEASTSDDNKTSGSVSLRTQLQEHHADLTHLQPPPEPADGDWRICGDKYTVSLGLSTAAAGSLD